MKLAVGEKPKCLREIEKHRVLYRQKNLKYVKNNWVFYWRFLCRLEAIGYRPSTISRYYSQIKLFLSWLGSKSLRHVKKKEIESYITHLKSSKRYKLYTMRYHREALCVFFEFVMRFSRMKVNPASNLAVRTHYPQPENMDFFIQSELEMMIAKPKLELERTRRCNFKTDHQTIPPYLCGHTQACCKVDKYCQPL